MDCALAAENGKETYFSHRERMFPLLEGGGDDAGGRIPTEQFLSACQGIAEFVGFLGTAFLPVKNDIAGNVHKVRVRFETDKRAMAFLQDLIDADLAERNGQLGVATEGLLWLKRGLEFMLEVLKQMVKQYRTSAAAGDLARTENLVSILRSAYEASLQRHHNFLSKQLFKVVIHAAPYRRTLLKALAYGNDGLETVCIGHIEALLANFEANVRSLVECYYAKGLETRPPSSSSSSVKTSK